MRMQRVGFLLIVLLLTACTAAPPPAPTPVPPTAAPTATEVPQLTPVTIGNTGNTADAPLFIAYEKGYFRDQGLDIKFQYFQSANDTIAPLGAGQLDVGAGAISAGLFNAVARGIDVKLVADKGQHSGSPVNGFTSAVVLVVPKGDLDKYHTLSDIKGKTVALNSTGTGNEIMLDRGLQAIGLSTKDITIKTLAFPDMLPALTTHSVDLAVEIEPFVTQGQAKDILEPWLKSEDLYAGQEGGVLIYGSSLTKQHPDIGDRFMVGYIKGVRDYYEAFGAKHKDRDQIATMVAKNASVKDVSLYSKMQFDPIDPDGYVNAEPVQYDLDWYASHGYVQEKPSMNQVIDNTFVDHALTTLGRYTP
jgi:ABC-type nitrate/sulfonate/bicarbonate transport system substrate-binding protein